MLKVIIFFLIFLVLLIAGRSIYLRKGQYVILSKDLDIEFIVYFDVHQKKTHATVYIQNARRLPEDYNLKVNSKIVEPTYYNSGESSGYKYITDLNPANEYVLVIHKEGEADIRKTIIPKIFSLGDIPDMIPKSKNLEIPMIVDSFPESQSVWISITNIVKEKGATFKSPAKAWGHGKMIKAPLTGKTLTIESKELLELKNIKADLFITMISKQDEGEYVVRFQKQIILVD
jgi:hypothetical protein